jgi:antiviral helicase SKI2
MLSLTSFCEQNGIRTAGVVVSEGVAGGSIPRLQVLEFGLVNPKRHASDILPYLPTFRKLFAPLPAAHSDMELRIHKIPVSDLECVTSTVVKIGGPTWYLNIKKGKRKKRLCLSF